MQTRRRKRRPTVVIVPLLKNVGRGNEKKNKDTSDAANLLWRVSYGRTADGRTWRTVSFSVDRSRPFDDVSFGKRRVRFFRDRITRSLLFAERPYCRIRVTARVHAHVVLSSTGRCRHVRGGKNRRLETRSVYTYTRINHVQCRISKRGGPGPIFSGGPVSRLRTSDIGVIHRD